MAPTHRITLRAGKSIEGRIEKDTGDSLLIRESYGYSGYLLTPVARRDILRLEPLPVSLGEITDDDVRFASEFAGMHFIKMAPYSVVTDESYSEVEKILRLLTELHRQFDRSFASLIRPETAQPDIQIIFFGHEPAYRAYARQVAPELAGSSGFYSTRDHRLALLNQQASSRYLEFQQQLTARQAIPALHLAAVRTHAASEARAMTERLIRHEGAHQLFHSYRIHSKFGVEPTWLTEGLAVYCETDELGRWHSLWATRLREFRDAGKLMPLEELLDHRDAAGFFALGEEQAEVAYGESWGLTYLLMSGAHRDGLLSLLKLYRDIPDAARAGVLEKMEPVELLERELGVKLPELEKQWAAFLDRL